jgi:pilus assembly protein CpaE
MLKIVAQRQAATGRRMMEKDSEGGPSGKVYAFFAPRGGSGKTTLAANLAVALAADDPDRVALMDLDVTFGHATLILNLTPKSSLAAITPEALRNLDRESINYYLVTHESSLRVLPGSSRPEEGETVSGDHVRGAIGQLKRSFGHIVVDTAPNFNETTLAALEEADKIAFIVNPDPAGIRDAGECIRIFTELLQMPPAKFYYVLNHQLPYKTPSRSEIEQKLGLHFAVEINHAGDMPAQASLRGEAFVLKNSGAQISKAIETMKRELERQATELSVGLIGSNR